MNVVVDTSVWSLAFRRVRGSSQWNAQVVAELTELIQEGRALLMGPIQTGVAFRTFRFRAVQNLRDRLRAFNDLSIRELDYERAAEFSNICRHEGVQGSHIDFLICSVAERNGASVFTTDRDLRRYAQPISPGQEAIQS